MKIVGSISTDVQLRLLLNSKQGFAASFIESSKLIALRRIIRAFYQAQDGHKRHIRVTYKNCTTGILIKKSIKMYIHPVNNAMTAG